MRMKLNVLGVKNQSGAVSETLLAKKYKKKEKPGYLIQGKVRIGQSVTISYEGKVERCIVIRTKRYTPTFVSFDEPAVMIKGSKYKAKGPISKGLNKYADILALGGLVL